MKYTNKDVIYRDDDIYLTESPTQGNQLYDLEKFIKVHEMIRDSGNIHQLAIIAAEIENYPELTKYLLEYKKEFSFQIHGWTHSAYTTWPKEHIFLSLKRAKEKITEVFGVVPTTFHPPWNKVNLDVLTACKDLSLEMDNDYCTPFQYLQGGRPKYLCFHYWCEDEVKLLPICLKL